MTATHVGEHVGYRLGADIVEAEVVEVRGEHAVIRVPVLGPRGEPLDHVLTTVPVRRLKTLEAC